MKKYWKRSLKIYFKVKFWDMKKKFTKSIMWRLQIRFYKRCSRHESCPSEACECIDLKLSKYSFRGKKLFTLTYVVYNISVVFCMSRRLLKVGKFKKSMRIKSTLHTYIKRLSLFVVEVMHKPYSVFHKPYSFG